MEALDVHPHELKLVQVKWITILAY